MELPIGGTKPDDVKNSAQIVCAHTSFDPGNRNSGRLMSSRNQSRIGPIPDSALAKLLEGSQAGSAHMSF